MAKILVCIFVAFAVQACVASPKARARQGAAQAAPQQNALEDLANQAKAVANNITETIRNVLPDSDRVTEVLKTQSQEFATNVKSIVDQLQTKINENQPAIDNAIREVSSKLSQTVQNLQQAAGPEATARAKELKQHLDDGVKNVAEGLDNLVKAVQPNLQTAGENISSFTKSVLDEFVENTKKLQTQVQSAVQNPH